MDGTDKKVRLVLDMRWVNGVMKDKNLHSYLVKKIELLFMAIHGSKAMTSFDITKAYRALVASFKLQQICAFRTPSSRKYPHVTWAFRSTCDGLANLPGYYSYLMQWSAAYIVLRQRFFSIMQSLNAGNFPGSIQIIVFFPLKSLF